jgi:hypothetical protein
MEDTAKRGEKTGRYALSWIDRLTDWVDRLPGQSWLYYLGFALVLTLAQALTLWLEGAFATGALPVLGFLMGMIAFFFVLCHYLSRRACAAMATLRPALKSSEQEYGDLCHRLATLPALPTLLAGVVILGIVLLTEVISGKAYRLEALDPFPVSEDLLRFVYLACWWVFGTFIYHTVHQLREVYRIYTDHTQIRLLRQGPLYAFSGVAALSAVGLMIPPYSFAVLAAIPLTDPILLTFILPITGLALAAFVWPMLGAHRLLVKEKQRMLDEAGLRFEAAVIDLHQRMDDKNPEGMDSLNSGLASLELEREALKGIPTWPWQPETARILATAVLLPLGLWLVQYVLQAMMER